MDPRDIAKGLTKAQRSVMLGHIIGWRPASYAQVKVGLRRKGLITNSHYGLGFTDSGLAVRSILQENPDA